MGEALIIDDHKLFGAGMKTLVCDLPGITDAHYYPTPAAALDAAPEDAVLIVADFYVPGYPAADWLPRLKAHFRDAVMVVVSSSLSRADRDLSLALGARAFFEKHAHPEVVLQSLTALLTGRTVETRSPGDPTGRLTPRQLDILTELVRGSSQKAIAARLGVSPETVKTHLSRLYRELGLSGREAAVQWARENGIA